MWADFYYGGLFFFDEINKKEIQQRLEKELQSYASNSY